MFAKQVREFAQKLPRTIANTEDIKQLVRSSGSIGANYIEANDSLGKKDFLMRVRISRKEAKESKYWLRLIYLNESAELERVRQELIREAEEFVKIFSAIIQKVNSRP